MEKSDGDLNKDMIELASDNEFWQKEVYRDAKVQIVVSIPSGEEIGTERSAPAATLALQVQ